MCDPAGEEEGGPWESHPNLPHFGIAYSLLEGQTEPGQGLGSAGWLPAELPIEDLWAWWASTEDGVRPADYMI